MKGFYKKVTVLLAMHGYSFYRSGKGDHEIWINTYTGHKATVPRNIYSRFTAEGILKQCGISKNELDS